VVSGPYPPVPQPVGGGRPGEWGLVRRAICFFLPNFLPLVSTSLGYQ
jgi:hypothetical protein